MRLAKGIARRLTLADILEEDSENKRLIESTEGISRGNYRFNYMVRTLSRITARMIGNLNMIMCATGAYYDPDKAARYLSMGAVSMAAFYFIDHLAYDHMKIFDPLKELRQYNRKSKKTT